MKTIPLYKFYRHKYGTELLIDVFRLDYIKDGIHRTPIHRETFFQIILFTEGSEEISLNGHRRYVNPGEIVCSIPGEIWHWNADTCQEGYVLVFEKQFLLSFFNDPHFLDRFSYLQADRPTPFLLPNDALQTEVLRLFHRMNVEIEEHTSKDQHILRAMLYEFLMLLNRADTAHTELTSPSNHTNHYIDHFIQLSDTDFVSHHDVAYYADKLCITPNYLNRLITEHLGVSTKQYLKNKLVDEAKRLLTYTTIPVNEISDILHFESVSYFVRFFRKSAGLSPLQFRNSAERNCGTST